MTPEPPPEVRNEAGQASFPILLIGHPKSQKLSHSLVRSPVARRLDTTHRAFKFP
jgi:hypothetical protein